MKSRLQLIAMTTVSVLASISYAHAGPQEGPPENYFICEAPSGGSCQRFDNPSNGSPISADASVFFCTERGFTYGDVHRYQHVSGYVATTAWGPNGEQWDTSYAPYPSTITIATQIQCISI